MKFFKVFILAMFFSKACQYATTDEKVCKNIKFVSTKYTHIDLQKCITWPKKSKKGRKKLNKACLDSNLPPRN
jgi:hypothetical protein